MLRICGAILLSILILLPLAAAGAEPVLNADGLTAWIGEENHMYLMDAAGTVKHLPAEIADLLRMDSQSVYCLTADQRVYCVYTDGSGSSIVYRNPTADQLKSVTGEPSWSLKDGLLAAVEASGSTREISRGVLCAAEAGGMLYYAEQTGASCAVRRALLETSGVLPGFSTFPDAISVDPPLHMTASSSALALTHEGGAVTVISLATGERQTVAALNGETAAAALVGDRLYRYTEDDAGYHLQQVDTVVFTRSAEAVTATPLPTFTPAPRPTATPRPAPTATWRPAPTQTPEDENIRRGENSARVRKMQKRLQELGYPVGSADGSYGRQTQIAVALFMSAVHFTEREYVTPKLLRRLYAADAPVYDQFMPLQKGDRGMAVRMMQQALQRLGYQLGTADGVYGRRTVDAVAAYMRAIGWYVPPTMVIGETAPRELLMNLYLTPTVPVGPVVPTSPPSVIDQMINDLEQQLNPL